MVSSKNFITLDLQKQSTSVIVPLKYGETGKQIVISIADGGFPYTISNDCYAVLTAQKPDGNVLYNHCTINENTIIYDVTEQTTAVVGTFPAAINLYGADDTLLVSSKFRFIVDGTIYSEDDVLSAPEVSALTHLISEATTTINTGKQTIQEGNAAAKSANEATNSANAAAKNANNSADAANASAERANTATNSANTAAGNAQTATQAANSAAASANQAAGKTNEAINAANDAAGKANEATKNANEAATKAAHTAKSLMVVGRAEGTSINMDDAIEQFFVGCRIFGKTTQEGTPTPDAPAEMVSVGDNGSVSALVARKNLFSKAAAGEVTQNGVTLTSNGNGSYTLRGTSVVGTSLSIPLDDHVTIPYGAYLHLMNTAVSLNAAFVPIFDDGTTGSVGFNTLNRSLSSDVYGGKTLTSLGVYLQSGITVDITFSPMLTFNSTAGTFEPYVGQTLTVSTPNGLPGIPVEEGGNYTDANGQQWVCDEIDLARGVYVQRVGRTTLNESHITMVNNTYASSGGAFFNTGIKTPIDDNKRMVICDRSKGSSKSKQQPTEYRCYSENGSVYVRFPMGSEKTLDEALTAFVGGHIFNVLATPIETPLSEEEIAAYSALHTYRDNTTVSNDASAHMELEYVMDAKKYIDSMISTSGIIPATVE